MNSDYRTGPLSLLFTCRCWFRALSGLAALSLGASLTWPLGYDHGIFSWAASTVRSGGVLYRDAWNTTGPAAYLPYLIAQGVFGSNTWGIRVIDACILLATTLPLAQAVRFLTNARTAAWTAVLFVLWYLSGTYYATAQPDGWVTLSFMAAVVALWTSERAQRARLWLLAGLVVGTASLVKPIYLTLMFVVCAPLVLPESRRLLGGTAVRQFAAFVLGFSLPVVFCVAWFFKADALNAFVDVYVNYALQVYIGSGSALADRLKGLAMYIQTSPLASLLFATSVLASGILWIRRRPLTLCLWSWFVVALGLVVAQNKFFIYQWTLIYPPMCILSAVGLHALLASPAAGVSGSTGNTVIPALWVPTRTLAVVWVGLVTLQCALHPAYESFRLVAAVTGAISWRAYDEGFGVSAASKAAAAYLRQRTTAQDHIAVWGWNAGVLYMAGRTSGSRFGFNMPLVLGAHSEFRARYRKEFLTGLRQAPPSYVLVDNSIVNLFGEPSRLAAFPEFSDVIDSCYQQDADFSTITLYRFSGKMPACSLWKTSTSSNEFVFLKANLAR